MEIGGLSLSGTQFSGESTSSPVLINVHNKIGAGSEMVRKQQPPPRGVPGKQVQRPHGGGKAKAFALPGEPIGMTRAKSWSPEVEEAFRLQEAGYKGVPEYLALGLEEPLRWENGRIRKLQTRHSLEKGDRVLLYFKRAPECEPRYLSRVKIYKFAEE